MLLAAAFTLRQADCVLPGLMACSFVCSDCWWGWLLVWVQTMVGLIMDAVMIGIIFARISHPKYRGRTIAISDSAIISRRDGVLKFMFRIADFRRTQVCPCTDAC